MALKRTRSLFVSTKSGFVSGIGRVDIGDVAVEGHPILKRAGGYFSPLVPRFGSLPEPDVEPAEPLGAVESDDPEAGT